MNETRSEYFTPNPLKTDTRTSLVILGILLAAAASVLVLQSAVYASSILQLWEAGQNIWGAPLSLMLQILAIWSVVLGVVLAVRYVTQPAPKYGGEFWEGVVTGFPLGLITPFVRVLGIGLVLYFPLGLLSLLVVEVYPYGTLQFAWLAAAYFVFLWIVVGMVPVLAGVFRLPKWYYKFLAVLLLLQLTLDTLQTGVSALQILLRDSIWQTNNTALLLALFGTLLVSSALVLWSFRGQPALTIVYAITAIYLASIVTGNFSERLFNWGEIPPRSWPCWRPWPICRWQNGSCGGTALPLPPWPPGSPGCWPGCSSTACSSCASPATAGSACCGASSLCWAWDSPWDISWGAG